MACNSGKKLCLHAGGPYFSIDETISATYLVSLALPRDWKASEERITSSKNWKEVTQNVDFRFRHDPRQILFRAKSLEEAVRRADEKVERLIKYPKLLTA